MRSLRVLAVALGLGVALAGIAAWQAPTLLHGALDGAAYRARIAAFATARLGRPVLLGGQIRLALSPGPVLVANDVVIADRGDGISARLHALRLGLSLTDLLRLRLVPRALVLDHPTVSLPWPLPRPAAPALPPGFSARLEQAVIGLGGLRFEAVDAVLQSDADSGAFTASGNAVFGGLPWHINLVMGPPGADGAASLAVTLDGQGSAHDTGGSLRGRIARDGAISGEIKLRGPDLSRLLAAPAAPFSLVGGFRLEGGTFRADELAVLLDGSAGQAGLRVKLTPPLAVDARLALGQITLGPWLAAPASQQAPVAARLSVSAKLARWRERVLRDASIAVTLGPDGAVIERAEASLAGDTRVSLHGTVAGGGQVLRGDMRVKAADARAALAWVSPAATAFVGEAPGAGEVAGHLVLSADGLALDGVQASLGQASLGQASLGQASLGEARARGNAAVSWGAKPGYAADLDLDNVTLPAVGGAADWRWLTVPGQVRLRLAHGGWRGMQFTHAVLDIESGADGLTVHEASADAASGHVQAAGAVGWDGTLSGARLDVRAADANALLLSLPARWRFLPRIFFGPAHLAVTAAGPPGAVSGQVLADLNDLRGEGEFHADVPARSGTATVTLRHPSAPTLLGELGVEGADQWLDHGSLALTAQLAATPGHIGATDFTLSAGVARMYGAASVDFGAGVPEVAARIHADSLALPWVSLHSDAVLPVRYFGGWRGSAQVDAGSVMVDLQPWAQHVGFTAKLADGVVSAENLVAGVAGGTMRAALSLDTAQSPPVVAAKGSLTASLPAVASAVLPVAPFGGGFATDFMLTARGFSPSAWLASGAGSAAGKATDVALPGIDLARVTELLRARPAKLRALLGAALGSGDSGKLSGDFSLGLDRGALSLAPAALRGAAGTVEIGGVLDLIDGSGEVTYRVLPALPQAASLGVTLAGPWSGMRRVVDVSAVKR